MNMSFVATPMTIITVPYSALGLALIMLPVDNLVVQFSVLDSEGLANEDGFDTVFEGGTVYALEGRLATSFADLPGHILLGGVISDKEFITTDQDPRLLLGLLPGVDIEPNRKHHSWAIYSNFDQYVWKPDPDSTRGVGVFGRLGFADDDTNPIEWSLSFGLSGQGLIPGREGDHFGLGYSILGANDKFGTSENFDDGHAVELYYDFEVTGWLHVTPDIQIVDPGVQGTDTAVVLGLRSKIEF